MYTSTEQKHFIDYSSPFPKYSIGDTVFKINRECRYNDKLPPDIKIKGFVLNVENHKINGWFCKIKGSYATSPERFYAPCRMVLVEKIEKIWR